MTDNEAVAHVNDCISKLNKALVSAALQGVGIEVEANSIPYFTMIGSPPAIALQASLLKILSISR